MRLHLALYRFDDSTGRILGVELQMLSLATGTAHPTAQGIVHLVLPPSCTRDPSSYPATKISLAGGFIGIMVQILRSDGTNNDDICHHWVCNWKTGEITVVNDSTSELLGLFSLLTQCFLRNRKRGVETTGNSPMHPPSHFYPQTMF